MLNGLIQKILKNEVQLKIKKSQKKTLNDDDTKTLMALFFHQLSRNFLEFLWILQRRVNYTELGNNILLFNLQSAFNKVHFTKSNLHSAISKT